MPSCEISRPGSTAGPEQPGLLEGVSAHGTRVASKLSDPFQPKLLYLIEISVQLANQRLGNSYSPVLKSLKRQVNSSNFLKQLFIRNIS